MRGRRALLLLLLAFVAVPDSARAAEHPALAKARALYNAGGYDEAITSAAAARLDPAWADAAALVRRRYRSR